MKTFIKTNLGIIIFVTAIIITIGLKLAGANME
jgi:hypothetical protein